MDTKATSQDNLLKSEKEYRNSTNRRVTFSSWFYQGRDLLTGKAVLQASDGQKLLADKVSNAGLGIGSSVSDYGTSYRQLAINARNVRTTKKRTEPLLLVRGKGDIKVLFLISAVLQLEKGNQSYCFHLLLVVGDKPDPDVLEVQPTVTPQYNFAWEGSKISCLQDQWVVSTKDKYYTATSVTAYPELVTPITGNWAVSSVFVPPDHILKSYLDGKFTSTTSYPPAFQRIFVSPTKTADFYFFTSSYSSLNNIVRARSFPVIYGVTKNNELVYKTRIVSRFASEVIRIKDLPLSKLDLPVISQNNQDGDGVFPVLNVRAEIYRAWNTGNFIGSAVVYDMLLGRIDYRQEGVAIAYQDDYFITYDLQDIPTVPHEMTLQSGVLTVKYELLDDNPSNPNSRYKLLKNSYIVNKEVPINGYVRVIIPQGRSLQTMEPSIYFTHPTPFATPVGVANLQKPILTITIDMKVDTPFLAIHRTDANQQTIFPYPTIEYNLNGVDLSSFPYSYTDWENYYNSDPIVDNFNNPVLFDDLPILNPPVGYEGFFLFGRCALSFNARQDLYGFNNLEFTIFDESEWSGYISSRFFLKQRREVYIPAPYIACNGDIYEADVNFDFRFVPKSIKLDANNKTSYWLSWSNFFLEYVYDRDSDIGTISSNWKFYQNNLEEDIATIGVIQPLHTTVWYCSANSANDYVYDFLFPVDVGFTTNVTGLSSAANELALAVNSAYSVNFVANDFLPYGASALNQLALPPAVSGFNIDADSPPSQYFVSLYPQAPYPISTNTIWGGDNLPTPSAIKHGTIFPEIDFHPISSSVSFSPNQMPQGNIVVYTCEYDNSGNYTYGFLESQMQGFDFGKWQIINSLAAELDGTVKELKFIVLDFDVIV